MHSILKDEVHHQQRV